MALLNNQFYHCRFWKRLPNSTTEVQKESIFFKAQLISDKERTFNQKIANLFTPQTKLALRTDSKSIFENEKGDGVRGYVEFQGDIYQIQAISYDQTEPSSLGSGRFSKKHTEKNAIKVITLI